MEKVNVRYETEIITESQPIIHKGFSGITFRNIGDDDVTVLENVPIKAHQAGDTYYDEFLLINRPGEVISHNINVKFAMVGVNRQLLIIKTFYEV